MLNCLSSPVPLGLKLSGMKMPIKRLFIHPCMLWLVCSAQFLFFRFWALMTKYIALNSYANVHSFSLWLIANADVTLESVTQLCLLYKRVTRVRAILSIAADVAFLNIFLKDNYMAPPINDSWAKTAGAVLKEHRLFVCLLEPLYKHHPASKCIRSIYKHR